LEWKVIPINPAQGICPPKSCSGLPSATCSQMNSGPCYCSAQRAERHGTKMLNAGRGAAAEESWRPRRDLNPCYRRESTRPSRLYKNLEGAGGAVRPLKLRRKSLSLHECYMNPCQFSPPALFRLESQDTIKAAAILIQSY
jgi:hypothetical protein